MKKTEMTDIVTFCKTKGFIYQGSEIYGGLANAWDYGQLGCVLKENIKNLWAREFVQKRKDMVMLDSSILMNKSVWEASGHVSSFSDPLMECKDCHTRHRADKLIEEELEKNKDFPVPNNWAGDKTSLEDLNEYKSAGFLSCPNCGKKNWGEVKRFNLMLETHQGVTQDNTSLVYLRPETAQGIFVNFQNVSRTSRKKLPFGIAQAGKAFRNEITPRNFIFRTREFEQIEIEYFCMPGTDEQYFAEWLERENDFLVNSLKLNKDNVRFVEIEKEALPHYSKRAGDFEYLFPFGWGEISTLANRTDYDLRAHMAHSKKDLSYYDTQTNTKIVPYVIEPSIGLSRLTLATICEAYNEIDTPEGKRVIMKFPAEIAPIKVGIYPLVKKFTEQADEIFTLLSSEFTCDFDEAGAIGKRYFRADEIGIPFSICVEDDNFSKGQVTVRERDTGEQEIVKITELVKYLKDKGC